MMDPLKASRKQEKRGAIKYGGSLNAGSGNKDRKNDVRTDDLSIEYKYTGKKSFSLKQDELLQAERHALLDGREMAFGIQMGDRHWVVLSEETFEALLIGSRRDAARQG
jgi:hypothetical protein